MNEDTKIKCTYCGALVDKTEEVCPQCSAPLKPAKPAKQQAKILAPTAVASLVLGILSINFSSLIIPGFILAAIGKRKANEGYDAIAANRITSKVGLILSIVMIPFWILYFTLVVIAVSEGY